MYLCTATRANCVKVLAQNPTPVKAPVAKVQNAMNQNIRFSQGTVPAGMSVFEIAHMPAVLWARFYWFPHYGHGNQLRKLDYYGGISRWSGPTRDTQRTSWRKIAALTHPLANIRRRYVLMEDQRLVAGSGRALYLDFVKARGFACRRRSGESLPS
jgi:hypothetical protein